MLNSRLCFHSCLVLVLQSRCGDFQILSALKAKPQQDAPPALAMRQPEELCLRPTGLAGVKRWLEVLGSASTHEGFVAFYCRFFSCVTTEGLYDSECMVGEVFLENFTRKSGS